MAIDNPKNSPLASCYIAFSSPEDADREHDSWIYNLFLYCFCTILKKKLQPWFVSSFEQTNKLFILFARLSLLPCVHFARIYARKRKIERKKEGERERGWEGGRGREREKEIRFRYHTFTIFFSFSIFSFFFVQFIVRSHFQISIFWRMEILLKEKFYALCQNKFWKRCEIFFLFFFFLIFLLFFFVSSSFLLHFFRRISYFQTRSRYLTRKLFWLDRCKKRRKGGGLERTKGKSAHRERFRERLSFLAVHTTHSFAQNQFTRV